MNKRVLTIAASDPSGGAGIEGDIKTIAAHGVFAMTAITAITAQDSKGVAGVVPTDPELFKSVLSGLARDLPIAAIKIGALADRDHLEAARDFLESLDPRPPVVVDPVIRSTSGAWLLAMDAAPRLAELLPLITIITPNLKEAGVLAKRPVREKGDIELAARAIAGQGASAVLVTGGHMAQDARDTLLYNGEIREWPIQSDGREYHGTGCMLSAAIAARLAQGKAPDQAVELARDYVAAAIKQASPGAGQAWILGWPRASG